MVGLAGKVVWVVVVEHVVITWEPGSDFGVVSVTAWEVSGASRVVISDVRAWWVCMNLMSSCS